MSLTDEAESNGINEDGGAEFIEEEEEDDPSAQAGSSSFLDNESDSCTSLSEECLCSRLNAYPALHSLDAERVVSTADNVGRLNLGLTVEIIKEKGMELADYERSLMADMYEMVCSDADRKSVEEMLLSHKHLLDRDISIKVFHNCKCLGMFEKPVKTQSVSDYSYWIRNGACRCVGLHNKRVSLRLLHIAAAHGNVWLTNILLDQGCDVCALTKHFRHSALHLAVHHCHHGVIKTLVERSGEKLKTVKTCGLIQKLIEEKPDNHMCMLKTLIDSGVCDVNEWDELNERSLSIAIEQKNIGALELLLCKGADPNLPNVCGKPMLHEAVTVGSLRCVQVLLAAGADANAACQEYGYTALMCALSRRFLDKVKVLLENGADPNAVSSAGIPAMHFVPFDKPNLDYIKLLIKHGADVNVTDTSHTGFSALHKAASANNLDCLKFLLENGALPDLRSKHKFTPLSLASYSHHLDCIRSLLKYPVNVNNVDRDGDTPIHAMAFYGSMDGLTILLDHEADPDIVNAFGGTPLWNAIYMGHSEIVYILVLLNVTLEICSRGNDQYLFDSYNTPYLYNFAHWTLWVAVDRDFPKIVDFLVDAGYNIWADKWLLCGDIPEEPLSHEDRRQLKRKLQEAARIVPSLLLQCRRHFRENYRGRLLSSVIAQCPLPVPLKDYILLREVPAP